MVGTPAVGATSANTQQQQQQPRAQATTSEPTSKTAAIQSHVTDVELQKKAFWKTPTVLEKPESMSVADLQAYITSGGLAWDDVITKEELHHRAKQTAAHLASHTTKTIALGKELHAKYCGNEYVYGLQDLTREELDACGGEEAFLQVFERFYDNLHRDPLMQQIFNENPADRTPGEHGRLLGGFVLAQLVSCTEDDTYYSMRRSGHGYGLGYAHGRSRACPFRPAAERGRGFLKSQGYAWLGHLSNACDSILGTGKPAHVLKNKIIGSLASRVFRMYGPWIDDM